MSTPPDEDARALEALEKRIDAAEEGIRRQQPKPDTSVTEASKAMGEVWQILLEFMVPIAVGGGLGFYADHYFHTKPWGLLILLLLGMGAGFTSLYRRANGYDSWRIGYHKRKNDGESSPPV
jgi:ATP synthase protein I